MLIELSMGTLMTSFARERQIEVRIAVDHQIVDVDGDLLGQAVRGRAQNVERASVAVRRVRPPG